MKRSTRLYILSTAHSEATGINRKDRRANAAKTAKALRQIVKRDKIDLKDQNAATI